MFLLSLMFSLVQYISYNSWSSTTRSIFLYHSFPFCQNQEFVFCRLVWWFLVKQRIFFQYFSITRSRFCNKKHLQPTYQNDWFVLLNVLLNFHYGSLLLLNWHIRLPFLLEMLPRMLQIFFFFVTWSHAKHLSCFKLSLDILLILTSYFCSRFQGLKEDVNNSISKFRQSHKLADKLSC